MIDEEFLTDPKRLHLEWPLYEPVEVKDEENSKKIYNALILKGKVDAYCVWCNKDRVFTLETDLWEPYFKWDTNDMFVEVTLECNMNSYHEYHITYFKKGNIFQKIGQFPSVADFQIPQVKKYRSVLGDEQYKELTRGVGLYAHGVGIGSFVYLRRIFENLIEVEHLKVKGSKKFSEKKYQKIRMDEKIEMLKKYLPKFLVENKKIYSILSKGIHELTEEECLKYFISVKVGIEQILDEKIIEKEKLEKQILAKQSIQDVSKELSSREKPIEEQAGVLIEEDKK